MYSEKVMKIYKHPHNVGKIKNADGMSDVGSPICGDTLQVYLKVKNGVIVDAKFESMGCAASVATGSMTTDLIKGKTIEEAEKLTSKKVIEELGGLPAVKEHCSDLATSALHAAIEDYKKKHGITK